MVKIKEKIYGFFGYNVVQREYDEIKKEKEELEIELVKKKNELRKSFRNEHKGVIMTLDVLFVIAILFNFGAVILTNMMVMKNNSEKGIKTEMIEMNPVTAKANDYAVPVTKEAKKEIKINYAGFLFSMFGWILIMSLYLFQRFTMNKDSDLYTAVLMIFILFILFGMDFFNDFGFWIGKMLY